jgi:predicted AlkP superfamily pyrophosphatase or phosphodiesterase
MRPSRILHLAIASALALAVAFGCQEAKAPERSRTIVIGIDGASPRLMTPMLAAGRLPHLAAIAERGVYGELRSELPLYSPRIWNTIATGRTPHEHGITGFVYKDGEKEAEQKRLYESRHRRVPALWNILSAAGRSVGVVNWWNTYPPDRVNGILVSDHFFPEQIEMLRNTFKAAKGEQGQLLHPASFLPRARAALEDDSPLTPVTNPFADDVPLSPWVRREGMSRQFRTDDDITRVAIAIEEDLRPEVMFVFFPGIDRVSHSLWGNIEPAELYPPGLRPTEPDRAGGAGALERYYEYTDALIGRLTAPYGPNDHVMVLSDHGFEAGVVMMLLTGEHETDDALDGVVFASGPRVARGEVGEMSIYDVAPTILAWEELGRGADMKGRPAAFLRGDVPEAVASWDDTPIERVHVSSTGMEEEIVERLRALGYLEEGAGGVDERSPSADGDE